MDFKTLLESGGNISLTVKVEDLREFGQFLIDEAKKTPEGLQPWKAEEYMSPDEVCQFIGIVKSTLWRWQKTGYLKPIKIGSTVRYCKSDIENILKGRKEQ